MTCSKGVTCREHSLKETQHFGKVRWEVMRENRITVPDIFSSFNLTKISEKPLEGPESIGHV